MKRSSAVLAFLLFSVPALHATSIAITLDQSNENFALIGLGNDSNGIGQFEMDLGPCSVGATVTTCTLTGRYTGGSPGYTAGNYTITTTYANGEYLPAYLTAPGTSVFLVGAPASDAHSTVTLDDDLSGTHIVDLLVNSSYVAGFDVTYASSSCVNLVDPCSMPNVGATPGASLEGPITGDLYFDTPSAVPEPSSLTLLSTGVLGLAGAARRKLRRS